MSECFLHVERGLKSEEVARQLLKEFPKCPIAMIAVGEAMSHPSCGKLTSAQLKEVDKLADDALKVEVSSAVQIIFSWNAKFSLLVCFYIPNKYTEKVRRQRVVEDARAYKSFPFVLNSCA